MREARESGAVEAWERGEPIQYQDFGEWCNYMASSAESPAFTAVCYHWRPKRAEPPKPVALDWRPVSEPPENGDVVVAWDGKDWVWEHWDKDSASLFKAWAPQPLPPEVK
jgi:hypothetical protein